MEKKKMYIKIKHPKLFDLYKDAINFYDNQISSIKSIKADSHGELLFKQILLQYCFISNQDLKSILILLQNEQFYTPHIILRSLFEYYYTIAYIEKNIDEHSIQYMAYSFKNNEKLIRLLKDNKDLVLDSKFDKKYIEIQNHKELFKEEINKWPSSIKEIAQKAGFENMYMTVYDPLSSFAHPDSRNLRYFFENGINGKLIAKSQKDTTGSTLLPALIFTNIIMSRLNKHYNLSESEKYENIQSRIQKI